MHWTSQLGLFEGFIIWTQSFDCCRLKHPKIDGSYLTHSWCQLKENCPKAGTSTRGWCMKCCRILFFGNDGEASTEETFISKKHFPCRFDPCGAKVEFQWCSKSFPLLFYMAIIWWTSYHIKATPQWLAQQDTRCQSLQSFGSKLEPCYKCYKFLQRIHLFRSAPNESSIRLVFRRLIFRESRSIWRSKWWVEDLAVIGALNWTWSLLMLGDGRWSLKNRPSYATDILFASWSHNKWLVQKLDTVLLMLLLQMRHELLSKQVRNL